MFDEADRLGHGRMIAPIRADGEAARRGAEATSFLPPQPDLDQAADDILNA